MDREQIFAAVNKRVDELMVCFADYLNDEEMLALKKKSDVNLRGSRERARTILSSEP